MEVRERAKVVRAREYASIADNRGTWHGTAPMVIPTRGIAPIAVIGATRQSTANTPQRVQDLDEEREAPSEKEVRDDRALNEFGLGGLELGVSVWPLDQDKDGPWTLVRTGTKGRWAVAKARNPLKLRELFQVDKEEERDGKKTSSRQGKYEMVKVTADSGAADHVAPVQTASHLEVQATDASRQGVKYVAANGHKIAILGANTDSGFNGQGSTIGHDLASGGGEEALGVRGADVRRRERGRIHQRRRRCRPRGMHGGGNRHAGKDGAIHPQDEAGEWCV